MNTIVLNTLTGAVSEYSSFDFQSITPTHAGSDAGLYALGGSLDVATAIASAVTTGKTLLDTSLKSSIGMVFFSVRGSGNATLTVAGAATSYSYSFPIRSTGQSRCQPGKGIRENYLSFGFSNVAGADFHLDRFEVEVAKSTSRRT